MPTHSLPTPGSIAFLGSGETSLAGGRIYERLARNTTSPMRVAILETPAGFELNASQVAGRVADFLRTRLSNYKAQVDVIPARKKGTAFSPDDPEILAPLLQANLIFMGPGSPTYAIRQLQNSLAWDLLRARHRLGATLVFASAATIAVGQVALPVYEIYKVGMDVFTTAGLDFFSTYQTALSFVPHWNNAEGGSDLDTSRCFMGMERFSEWFSQLPGNHTTLGLDEHSGVIFDFASQTCEVMGVSSVSLLRNGQQQIFPAGSSFAFSEIGTLTLPEEPGAGISNAAWEMALAAHETTENAAPTAPPEVESLAQARQDARARKDWAASDEYRRQILALGWTVQDTPEGPKLVKA